MTMFLVDQLRRIRGHLRSSKNEIPRNGVQNKKVMVRSIRLNQPIITVVVYTVQRTRDLDTADLLEQLPALQQLLFRLLACQVR